MWSAVYPLPRLLMTLTLAATVNLAVVSSGADVSVGWTVMVGASDVRPCMHDTVAYTRQALTSWMFKLGQTETQLSSSQTPGRASTSVVYGASYREFHEHCDGRCDPPAVRPPRPPPLVCHSVHHAAADVHAQQPPAAAAADVSHSRPCAIKVSSHTRSLVLVRQST